MTLSATLVLGVLLLLPVEKTRNEGLAVFASMALFVTTMMLDSIPTTAPLSQMAIPLPKWLTVTALAGRRP